MTVPSRGSLGALGIDDAEELVYRFLLRAGPSARAVLQRSVDLASSRIADCLRRLESKGLVSRSAHRRPLFVAVSPELALEDLFSRRFQELEGARAAAGELIRSLRQEHPYKGQGELVEIISGRDAITERALQLQRATTDEVLIFDQPPYATADGGQNQGEVECLRRGVRYRVIYDHPALEWPGQTELLEEIIAEGEQARATPTLPMKLAISDRSAALLPLRLGDVDVERPERIVVHPSPLLDSLVTMFEMFWDRATPIYLSGERLALPGLETPVELSSEDRRVLGLLVSGLKDDAIGRQLGMARRTVQRRIRGLIDKTGTSSRLDLIVHAVAHGAAGTEGEGAR